MNRYEGVSDDAKDVLRRANDVAMAVGAEFIQAEHILIALLDDKSNSATKAFQSLGLECDSLRTEVLNLAKSALSSAGMKQVIDNAISGANGLGQKTVQGAHLLLGLLRLDGSVTLHALRNLGLNRDQVRAAVLRVIGQSG